MLDSQKSTGHVHQHLKEAKLKRSNSQATRKSLKFSSQSSAGLGSEHGADSQSTLGGHSIRSFRLEGTAEGDEGEEEDSDETRLEGTAKGEEEDSDETRHDEEWVVNTCGKMMNACMFAVWCGMVWCASNDSRKSNKITKMRLAKTLAVENWRARSWIRTNHNTGEMKS